MLFGRSGIINEFKDISWCFVFPLLHPSFFRSVSEGLAMVSHLNLNPLPHHLAWTIRKADVLTGEFLRPVSGDVLAELATLGLASPTQVALTRHGMEMRSWLMCGTERAPREMFRVLEVAAGRCTKTPFAGATSATAF